MEDGFHLAVGEQRGLAIDGRAHVADDQPEVGLARAAGVQRVHPRAAALRFARVPVGIERPEVRAGLRVVDFVERNLGMPDFDVRMPAAARRDRGIDGFQLADGDAEEAGGDFKHAGHHAIDREIRAQHLVIEVVVFLALAFGPVGGLPWFERGRRVGRSWRPCIGRVGGNPHGTPGRMRACRFSMNSSAPAPVLAMRRSNVRSAKWPWPRIAAFSWRSSRICQTNGGVVILAVAADSRGGLPDLAAEGVVVRVLHDRKHRGKCRVKRHAGCSSVASPLARALAAAAAMADSGRPASLRFVGDDQLPGVGRVEHVLGVLLGEL